MADNPTIRITADTSGVDAFIQRSMDLQRQLQALQAQMQRTQSQAASLSQQQAGQVWGGFVPPPGPLPGTEGGYPGRRLRPWPPGIYASPFGRAAGGPPGAGRPPEQQGIEERLRRLGLERIHPGTGGGLPGGGGGPPHGGGGGRADVYRFDQAVMTIGSITSSAFAFQQAVLNFNAATTVPMTIASVTTMNVGGGGRGGGGRGGGGMLAQMLNQGFVGRMGGGAGGGSGGSGGGMGTMGEILTGIIAGGIGGIGGTVGGALGGAVGTLAGMPGIGALLGAQAGQLVQRGVETGMRLYEEQERGILAVGAETDQQFGRLRETIHRTRQELHSTQAETIQAMHILGQLTGQPTAGLGEALRTGRAYGLSAAESATVQGTLAQMTLGQPNLNTMAGIFARARREGATFLPVSQLVHRASDVAAVGGIGAAPRTDEQIANIMASQSAIGGPLNPRFRADPAQAFAREYTGLQQPADAVGESIRAGANARILRRGGVFHLGGRTYNANRPEDMRILDEEAADIPEKQQAMMEEIRERAGTNEQEARRLYRRAFNVPTSLEAQQRYERKAWEAAQPGGIPGQRTRPGLPGQGQTETERIAAQEGTFAGQERAAQARLEDALTQLRDVQHLAEVKLSIETTMTDWIEKFNRTGGVIETTERLLSLLNTQLERAVTNVEQGLPLPGSPTGLPGARGTIEEIGQEAVNEYWRRRQQPKKAP